MKKDIIELESEGVEIVVAPRPNENDGELWDVWLVNHNDYPLENILVSSKGYGTIEGREKKTATLRHFIETLAANSTALVEPIQTAVFGITNEYWLSYNKKADMLEKKFIFQPNTISVSSLTRIKTLDRAGVTA